MINIHLHWLVSYFVSLCVSVSSQYFNGREVEAMQMSKPREVELGNMQGIGKEPKSAAEDSSGGFEVSSKGRWVFRGRGSVDDGNRGGG